jgi:dipeptidyl aminopeptidase/acylaminoacyl peptidase
VSYSDARFSRDGKSVYVASDRGSEFMRLIRLDIADGKETVLTKDIPWDVENFDLSPDGKTIAFVTNEDGASRLHLRRTKGNSALSAPKLPLGVVGGVRFHENSRELAFTLSSAKSPSDVYSYALKDEKLERWTESETGGLKAEGFVEPELVKIRSFDGVQVSAFLYRPNPTKFPGKRPVLVSIHGGPESQSRPSFMARNNYYLDELGVALLVPNVRGSAGYGKTFLTLDNGFKREDSVKDIGAFIDWVAKDARLDGGRVAVMGGSYGGYMVLASMVHFNDRLRCGIDIVGISNFLTFLKNTQDYRRDLRRVEYGDERIPDMAKHLEAISPALNASKIRKPLFVVQGKNDPRVPITEAEQMVKAIRDQGGSVWYLMAKDEGHGFAKKKNADFQFLSQILFLRENLLK